MANTIENTLNKIGNTIENILGSNKKKSKSIRNSTNQSCLELNGMEARKEHLYRNEWKKDFQYTKALVNSEYEVQTEFKVSTVNENVATQVANAKRKEASKNKN